MEKGLNQIINKLFLILNILHVPYNTEKIRHAFK